MRDTQADVPSARRRWAQLAFKDSMVHGILQFTPSIAFRYVLHRCESRDIRCRESLSLHDKNVKRAPDRHTVSGAGGARGRYDFLGASRAGVWLLARAEHGGEGAAPQRGHLTAPPSSPDLRAGDGRSACAHPPAVKMYVSNGRSFE